MIYFCLLWHLHGGQLVRGNIYRENKKREKKTMVTLSIIIKYSRPSEHLC